MCVSPSLRGRMNNTEPTSEMLSPEDTDNALLTIVVCMYRYLVVTMSMMVKFNQGL